MSHFLAVKKSTHRVHSHSYHDGPLAIFVWGEMFSCPGCWHISSLQRKTASIALTLISQLFLISMLTPPIGFSAYSELVK